MTLTKAANWTLKFACFLPLAYWVAGVLLKWLGVEPLVKINTQSGYVVLVFIIINSILGSVHSLKLLSWNIYGFMYSSRRYLGVFCGIYVILHFLTYLAKESFLAKAWVQAITKNYLIAGSTAAIIILILMLTSNDYSARFLKKNWKKLHKLIYLSYVSILFHIFLIEKANLLLLALIVFPAIVLQLIRIGIRFKANEIS